MHNCYMLIDGCDTDYDDGDCDDIDDTEDYSGVYQQYDILISIAMMLVMIMIMMLMIFWGFVGMNEAVGWSHNYH